MAGALLFQSLSWHKHRAEPLLWGVLCVQSQAREECERDSVFTVVVWAADQPFLLSVAFHQGWSRCCLSRWCLKGSARVALSSACLCSIFLSISILNTHDAYVEQLVIIQNEEAKAEGIRPMCIFELCSSYSGKNQHEHLLKVLIRI